MLYAERDDSNFLSFTVFPVFVCDAQSGHFMQSVEDDILFARAYPLFSICWNLNSFKKISSASYIVI